MTDYHDFTTQEMPLQERRALDVGDIWINAVRCLLCKETIRSCNRHDYVHCRCGNIAVDGGSWYMKRTGGVGGYEDLSEMYTDCPEKEPEQVGGLEDVEGVQHDKLSDAITLAADLHKDQRDKGGNIYILHPLSVMFAVAPDRKAMQVAVLHDVLEDTPCTYDDLVKLGLNLDVCKAVEYVTRPEGPDRPTYKEFIQRIADAPGEAGDLARTVKTADLKHNMSPDRMDGLSPDEKGLMNRYRKALNILNSGDA